MLYKQLSIQKLITFFLCITILVYIQSFSYADGFSNDPPAMNEKAKSVVMLTINDKNNNPIKTGSGFVIFDNRTLVTNYHVIDEGVSILAESDEGYKYNVTGILCADKEKDIAILQFMAPTVMMPLEYTLEQPLRGAPIVVIGSPKGLRNTISIGNISSLYKDTQSWIQFTAPASPGSSGGPVFDDSGRVIGMTTMNITDGQNLNFALGVEDIINLYQKWDKKTVTDVGTQSSSDSSSSKTDNTKNDDSTADKSEDTSPQTAEYPIPKVYFNGRYKHDVGKDGNDVWRLHVKNPKNGKKIKAIEMCMVTVDVWGEIDRGPIGITVEQTIKPNTSKDYKYKFPCLLLFSNDEWRELIFGISRIVFSDGTIIEPTVEEGQWTVWDYNKVYPESRPYKQKR